MYRPAVRCSLRCSHGEGLAVHRDTVYALSTPKVAGAAIAVIRLSGPHSGPAVQGLLGSSQSRPRPRVAALRSLHNPQTGDLLDRSVVLWLPQPATYTGQDMVELHVHGGAAIVSDVVSALTHFEQLREAGPGEFTRIAHSNGRLDLSQAEGIGDLIRAQTSRQRQQALRLAGGDLRVTCDGWKENLIQCLARTETLMDFAEDEPVDDDGTLWGQVLHGIDQVIADMASHLRGDRAAEMVREGLRLSIVGPPNAGKSSLFNRLLKRPAAIVSPHAGTTRDVIDANVRVGDWLLSVADSAGVRDTDDPVEAEGVKRALDSSADCDLRIVVVESTPQDFETDGGELSLVGRLPAGVTLDSESTLLVLNKVDLIRDKDQPLHVTSLNEGAPVTLRGPTGSVMHGMQAHYVSCTTSAGLAELGAAIESKVEAILRREGSHEAGALLHQRHRLAISRCLERLRASKHHEAQPELAAEELREAMRSLGAISGNFSNEEVLDRIFRDFCIGK